MADSIIYTLVLDNGMAFNVGPVISPNAMQVLEITEEVRFGNTAVADSSTNAMGFCVKVSDEYTIKVPYHRMVYIGYRLVEK